MEEQKVYAEQWNNSSYNFYDNGSYFWMCEQIKKYHTILEIGCGTGQSTLSLVEKGHKVICIEKNNFCIEKAKLLLKKKGYTIGTIECGLVDCDVVFLASELFDANLLNSISHISFDAVICWNIGSYWNKSMLQYYMPYMIEYGLTQEQIYSDLESSYSELIQWKSCKIAREHRVPVHLIDRNQQEITKIDDIYYVDLKKEFNFSKIYYDNIKTESISNGGRILSSNGKILNEDSIILYLISVIIIP